MSIYGDNGSRLAVEHHMIDAMIDHVPHICSHPDRQDGREKETNLPCPFQNNDAERDSRSLHSTQKPGCPDEGPWTNPDRSIGTPGVGSVRLDEPPCACTEACTNHDYGHENAGGDAGPESPTCADAKSSKHHETCLPECQTQTITAQLEGEHDG